MIMNGMEERLAEFLHVKTFEELKIPLVITASDINGAVPVHFEKGELLPCIIASCSIPVVFTPPGNRSCRLCRRRSLYESSRTSHTQALRENYSRRNQFDRYFGKKNHQHDRYGYPFFFIWVWTGIPISTGICAMYSYPPKYDQIQHVRSGTHQRDL